MSPPRGFHLPDCVGLWLNPSYDITSDECIQCEIIKCQSQYYWAKQTDWPDLARIVDSLETDSMPCKKCFYSSSFHSVSWIDLESRQFAMVFIVCGEAGAKLHGSARPTRLSRESHPVAFPHAKVAFQMMRTLYAVSISSLGREMAKINNV